jgi:hypothetical protein
VLGDLGQLRQVEGVLLAVTGFLLGVQVRLLPVRIDLRFQLGQDLCHREARARRIISLLAPGASLLAPGARTIAAAHVCVP